MWKKGVLSLRRWLPAKLLRGCQLAGSPRLYCLAAHLNGSCFSFFRAVCVLPMRRKQDDPPAATLEPFPPLPALEKLVFVKEKCLSHTLQACQDQEGLAIIPGIPDELVNKWYHDEAFKKFHDKMVEEFGAFHPTAPAKRSLATSGDGGNPSPLAKRGRVVGPESVVTMDSLKGQETQQARDLSKFQVLRTYVKLEMGLF